MLVSLKTPHVILELCNSQPIDFRSFPCCLCGLNYNFCGHWDSSKDEIELNWVLRNSSCTIMAICLRLQNRFLQLSGTLEWSAVAKCYVQNMNEEIICYRIYRHKKNSLSDYRSTIRWSYVRNNVKLTIYVVLHFVVLHYQHLQHLYVSSQYQCSIIICNICNRLCKMKSIFANHVLVIFGAKLHEHRWAYSIAFETLNNIIK